ncbi:MAG: glycoside hydrolase family 15 protein [Fimbriimonadaceae bacterium]|nr:glycoside hydrolase family 15 protein [Fimbriimonadaceae bacterium]
MPRPLVFGNGSLLICHDHRYCMRDLYWPHVGLYNHINGHACRVGVWADGAFGWIDEDGWQRTLGYEPGSLVGQSEFVHHGLKLKVEITEAVHPFEPWYLRRFAIHDLSGSERDVRLFINSDFRLNESDAGDTAFFNPFADAMVHYKRETVLALSGRTSEGGLFEYTTAHRGFSNFQGSSEDARDGSLGWNPMTYGCTDSTYSLKFKVPANGDAVAHAWIVVGSSIDDAAEASAKLVGYGFDEVFEETRKHWRDYLAQSDPHLLGLPDDLCASVRQGLLILRTQIDNGGGILAANDSDIMSGGNQVNYSNVWPRDGAFVASVLIQAGYPELADKYFQFSEKLITPHRPYFLQKYWADGTVGPGWHAWMQEGAPEVGHQQDETALTVFELCNFLNKHCSPEAISHSWESFVKPATDHILAFRDANGLPKPSWDLWEERRGIHIYTVSTVIVAFRKASELALQLGDNVRAHSYSQAAVELLAALKKHMWDDSRGCFYRRLIVKADGSYEPDLIIDSSSMQVLLLGVLPADDPMVVSNLAVCDGALWVSTTIGGMARYQDDYYHRVSHDVPGNPWIICTMWLAQSLIAMAQTVDDLQRPEELLRWALDRAEGSGVLAEQLHPFSGEPMSVSPLTWSHAEVVKTAVELAGRMRGLD